MLRKFHAPDRLGAALDEIRAVERESHNEATLRELPRAKWVRPVLVAACGLTMLQQFVGVNTISYYAPTFLSKAGLGNSTPILNSVGMSVCSVVVSILCLVLIDRIGRRPLLLGGLVAMVFTISRVAETKGRSLEEIGVAARPGIHGIASLRRGRTPLRQGPAR